MPLSAPPFPPPPPTPAINKYAPLQANVLMFFQAQECIMTEKDLTETFCCHFITP